MRTRARENTERGSVIAWIVWILLLILVLLGGFAMLVRFSIVKLPESLSSQPWIKPLLPEQETQPAQEEPVAVSVEDTLRQQIVLLNSQYLASQSQIDALKQQVEEKDRIIQAKDDEIARLQSAVNLAAERNISNVALMYEAMEPAEAAVILANLGAEQAALILGAMRESKAGDILATMDPALATQITRLMAGFVENPQAVGTGSQSGQGTAASSQGTL